MIDVNITDPIQIEKLKNLASTTVVTMRGRGLYLIRAGAYTVPESQCRPQRLTIVEFESMETAKVFHNSPVYRRPIFFFRWHVSCF